MAQVGWSTYLERLGPEGLRVVVSGLLDDGAFAELSGQSPAGLPSADRARLLTDLSEADSGRAEELLAALDERRSPLDPPPENWTEQEVRERLAAILRAPDASAASVLHALARAQKPPLPAAEIRAAAEVIAPELIGEEPGSRPKWLAKVASDRAGVREIERERRELEGRVRQLERQLNRALDRSSSLEDRLSQRVAELQSVRQELRSSREERQRLEREVARLEKRNADLLEKRAKERTGEITTALRRLTTEQRRAGSTLKKLLERETEATTSLREQGRTVNQLSTLIERVIEVQEAQARTGAMFQEQILRELLSRNEDGDAAQEKPEDRQPARKKRRGQTQRVGMFVDVQNMFYAAREKNSRLDFEALLSAATGGRQLVRAVAYLVETKEIDQSNFIHLLQMKAYEVKRKPLKVRADHTAKGNWDLEMALDALTTSEHLDVVVLVTGDGDFVPLVRQLKLNGLRVEVYGFTASTAPDLREAADKFVPITKRLLRPVDGARRGRRSGGSRGAGSSSRSPGGATESGASGGSSSGSSSSSSEETDARSSGTSRRRSADSS
jgi:uncharacterized LabA/DUF88 family protein